MTAIGPRFIIPMPPRSPPLKWEITAMWKPFPCHIIYSVQQYTLISYRFLFDTCTNNCITRKLIVIDLLAILSIPNLPGQEDTIWVPAFVKYTIYVHTATLTSSPCSIVMKDFLVCTYSRNFFHIQTHKRSTDSSKHAKRIAALVKMARCPLGVLTKAITRKKN